MSAPPTADSRYEQLLTAAASVIGERGFADTRLADVAREAGVSPALVVYYFETRERLLLEALRHNEDAFHRAVVARLAELGTASERLSELVRLSCSPEGFEDSFGGWSLWFDLWVQAARNPAAARDRAELDDRWRATVADIVREGQRTGEFGPTDADQFAQTLGALLDGLAVQVTLADRTVTAQRALEIATAMCRVLLHPNGSAPA